MAVARAVPIEPVKTVGHLHSAAERASGVHCVSRYEECDLLGNDLDVVVSGREPGEMRQDAISHRQPTMHNKMGTR